MELEKPPNGKWPLAAILITSSLALYLFNCPMLIGKINTRSDIGAALLPYRYIYHRALQQGTEFIWTSQFHGGFYMQGEAQGGMFHPWLYLLYRFLPLTLAFNIEMAAIYPFAIAGMFLFLRRWRLPRYAALFGGVVYAFSGYMMLHAIHPIPIAIAAHIPWLLWACDIAVRASSRRELALGVGVVIALTVSGVLLGHYQHVYFSCLAEGLYVLFLLVTVRGGWRVGVALLAAKVLALLVTAVQILPTYDLLQHSDRQGADQGFLCSLDPFNAVQLIAPYMLAYRVYDPEFHGHIMHEYGLYGGAITTILLVWAMARFRRLGRMRGLTAAALGLAVLAALLSTGDWGGVYGWLLKVAPVLQYTRCASRHILLLNLAMAILAAIALADVAAPASGERAARWRRLWPMALVAGAGWMLAMVALIASNSDPKSFVGLVTAATQIDFAGTKGIVTGAILMSVAALLLAGAACGKRGVLVAALVFAVTDQAYYGLTLHGQGPMLSLKDLQTRLDAPKPMHGERVTAWSMPNIWVLQDLRMLRSYTSMTPKKLLDYNELVAERAAGVRWRLTRNDMGPLGPADYYMDVPLPWAELDEPIARARLVSRAVVSQDPRTDIKSIDLLTTVLVPEPVDLSGDEAGTVALEADDPGKIRARTVSSGRQIFSVTESYYEGWHAAVDGVPTAVIRVNGDVLGCVVEPGERSVELWFDPDSYRLGKRLSLLGIAVSLAAVFGLFRWGSWFLSDPATPDSASANSDLGINPDRSRGVL